MIEETAQTLGDRAKWEVHNMQTALSLHMWLNTVEENKRLEACRHALGNWQAYRNTINTMRGR
jgi:hypothetical protein